MDITERIRQVFDNKRKNFKDFSDISDVKYRTLQSYLEGRMPSAEFLIEFNRVWNVSIDWLLTGRGNMYLSGKDSTMEYFVQDKVQEDEVNYRYPGSARAQRLNVFINHWLNDHNGDEQAWFEVDFKKNYPDYSDWLDKHDSSSY